MAQTITVRITNFAARNREHPGAVADVDRAIVAAGGIPGHLDNTHHTYTIEIIDPALNREQLVRLFARHGFRIQEQ